MIVFSGGEDFLGKTDRVKGLFFVVTRFVHIFLIPIFPQASYCMLDQGTERKGVPIPLSGKSILFAYLRGWIGMIGSLALLGLLFEIYLVIPKPGIEPDISGRIWFGSILAGLWALLFSTYFFSKPSPQRAIQLAEQLGIPLETLMEHYHDPRLEEMVKQMPKLPEAQSVP